MQNRRNFLGKLAVTGLIGAPFLGSYARAQEAIEGISLEPDNQDSVSLVMLVNFFCANSYQANFQTARIVESCQIGKIGFRFAPVSQEPQTPWPDRIYYTVREMYPLTEPLVRNALFEGTQKKGLPFESMSQVLTYLMNTGVDKKALEIDRQFDLSKIANICTADEIDFIRFKAIRLSIICEKSILPVFLWLKNGEIIKELSPEDHPNVPILVNNVVKSIIKPNHSYAK